MMTEPLRRAFAIATIMTLAVAMGAVAGCSFSYSSDSIARSSDSSSRSSESSGSSSEDDTAQYRSDVEQYTESFVRAGGSRDGDFFAGLGDLARARGVSDWESEPSTWEAIGRGLARTQVTDAQRTAFESAWADGDAARQSAIRRGYAASR